MDTLPFAIADDVNMGAAVLPARKTAGSAGMDLMTAKDVTIPSGAFELVPTGLRFAEPLPDDEMFLIFARSSLFKKFGLLLTNGVGLVDSDYPGHIMLPLVNVNNAPAVIPAGTALAQAVVVKHVMKEPVFAPVNQAAFAAGTRTGGFGSTDAT